MDATTPPLTGLRNRAIGVRRLVLRRRRALAVLLTVVAVGAGLSATAPPAPETVAVTVTAGPLPAGTVLAQDDVTTVRMPPAAAPAAPVTDPVGATLAGPMGAGEPLTAQRVLGSDLTAAAPGRTAVPVRIGDAAQADLLRVGMRIDLLATDPQQGTTATVATDVTVLGLPADATAGAGGATAGRVVVLGMPDAAVAPVTAATVAKYVTFAWVPV
ncbi:SAF domain-containing protein [Nocardioides panacisoli]|uniref:SAF domain-containing protein n=1 Tax=Nocardioides panacisoli TaxID=627624 RepID=UPI001C6319E8|nr:SAF domain-containing protein [Nocardioides panacisoli]QYJ02825.1 SAF domain-containing protein [Nocardioides panacisoli]